MYGQTKFVGIQLSPCAFFMTSLNAWVETKPTETLNTMPDPKHFIIGHCFPVNLSSRSQRSQLEVLVFCSRHWALLPPTGKLCPPREGSLKRDTCSRVKHATQGTEDVFSHAYLMYFNSMPHCQLWFNQMSFNTYLECARPRSPAKASMDPSSGRQFKMRTVD